MPGCNLSSRYFRIVEFSTTRQECSDAFVHTTKVVLSCSGNHDKSRDGFGNKNNPVYLMATHFLNYSLPSFNRNDRLSTESLSGIKLILIILFRSVVHLCCNFHQERLTSEFIPQHLVEDRPNHIPPVCFTFISITSFSSTCVCMLPTEKKPLPRWEPTAKSERGFIDIPPGAPRS